MRIRRIAVGLVLLAAAWLNYDALSEAFGSGPPYHGRTANMDKWTNPIPHLAVLDILIVGALALTVKFTRSRLKDDAN